MGTETDIFKLLLELEVANEDVGICSVVHLQHSCCANISSKYLTIFFKSIYAYFGQF